MSIVTTQFKLTPPTLPSGYCPTSWQNLANVLVGNAQVTQLVNVGTQFFNFGSTTPSANNRIYPWLNTSTGLWYTYQFGLWVTPNSVPASSPFLWLWTSGENGSLSGLWLADGGDGTDPRPTLPDGSPNPAYVAPTAITGAMWMVNHALDARFALAPGTLPSAAVVTVNDTGGEETHMQLAAEVAKHQHDPANGSDGYWGHTTTGSFNVLGASIDSVIVPKTGQNDTLIPQTATPNMPPWYAAFYVQRTARVWMTLPA